MVLTSLRLSQTRGKDTNGVKSQAPNLLFKIIGMYVVQAKRATSSTGRLICSFNESHPIIVQLPVQVFSA